MLIYVEKLELLGWPMKKSQSGLKTELLYSKALYVVNLDIEDAQCAENKYGREI